MTNTFLNLTTALRSGTVALAIVASSAAFAQTVPQTVTPSPDPTAAAPGTTDPTVTQSAPSSADVNDTGGSDILVTGSRIRRPNLQSTVPITSVNGEEFFSRPVRRRSAMY